MQKNPFGLTFSNTHPEMDFMLQMFEATLTKSFPNNSYTVLLDSKYCNLYSDLITKKSTNSKSFSLNSSRQYKQNKLVDNFLFLKRINLDSFYAVEQFLIFLDLYLLANYHAECKSYSIIAYRYKEYENKPINSKENNKSTSRVLEILYQDEMDMIVAYPILEDYFVNIKRMQAMTDKEKDLLFDTISDFILNLGGNYIEKIDCFYTRMDFLYHIEQGKKGYVIKFSKEEDLNEFYFVNRLRIQYEHMHKAIKNDETLSLPHQIWAFVAIQKRLFQLKCNKEALSLIEETLELRKEVWGLTHFETYDSWSRLAASLFREKEYACALEIYLKVLEKRKEMFPENSKPVLLTIYNIAVISQKQGEFEKALGFYENIEKNLKDSEEKHDSSFYNDVLLGKALCCKELKKVDRALEGLEEIVQKNGEKSYKTPLILNNMAVCYKNKRNYSQYYCFKLEAYLIYKKIKGEEKAKKKELEEIFKENHLQQLFFMIYMINKVLRPIYKRKIIVDEIINHLI